MSAIESVAMPRSELSASQRRDMFVLLDTYFEGVTRDQFARDLAEKNHVILLYGSARLLGFSTLLAYESCIEGSTVSVICSGDTIVAPEAWNSPALARAWIACVRRLRESFPRGKYYWLLLTSGYRTYRFLPVFWRNFYPRFDVPTPKDQARLLDFLAGERFGGWYAPESGIVRFAQPQRLRGPLKVIPPGRINDPHTAFFASRNPGHVEGDELVCLTELNDDNLTRAGRRMVEAGCHELSPR